MIRFVILAVVVLVGWLVMLKLYRQVKQPRLDWTGIAAIIGFIALAFYLRYATGFG
ncbi:hypothetical protein [Aminobacter sp. HY435]|uniref:hypothetical protein n=1 Tax=Aminobacter sp. HY435 TaxID=2970917 RepID=UPI0022B966B5|nr:hypothetical protein [Aminobacter sp. HY435]